MLIKYLVPLIKRNYERESTNRLIILVNECDNEQIEALLNEGFYLGNNMFLQYTRGLGFRCFNKDEHLIGKNHNCRLIQNFLNKEILK